MPSATHQNFVLLFRNHPNVAFELARRAGAPISGVDGRLEEADTEFDEPLLKGRIGRADLAILEHAEDEKEKQARARRGLVLEVQLGVDLDKQWSILLYRAGLRRRHRCPAWALVFSPAAEVRAAFRERMFVEEPELRPLMVTPEMIPIIRDLDEAIDNYPWAVLAACMHATGPHAVACATLAIRALLRVAPDDYGRYIELVSTSVGEEVMQQVREQLALDDEEELSDWERRGSSFTRGRREGLQEGLQAALERMRKALLRILEARGLAVDEQTSQRVADCSDGDQLTRLLVRAATISTADELFSTH